VGRFQVFILFTFSGFVLQSREKGEGGLASLVKRLWLFGFAAEKFRTGMRIIQESCLTVFLALFSFFLDRIRCLFVWYDFSWCE